MTPLHIALVVDHFLPRIGGIEIQVSQLAEQLARAGHHVTVITTTPGAKCGDEFVVERLPARLIPKYQIAWTLGPLRQIKHLLAARQFDIVHCHSSIYSPLAYAALVWCQQLKLPSVLTVHSIVRNTSRLFGELDRYVGWRHWPTIWSTISHFNAELMRRNARLSKVHVIPNGIHVRHWRIPSQLHSDLCVMSVLRLNQKKRPHDLIRAIPAVLEHCSKENLPVRFRVIGDGPLRSSVEQLAKRLGVSQQIEFHGALKHAAIRDLFASSDVFAHPTTTEAFGIAVLEAMASGLPVVARAGCGVSDLVDHGSHGFLASDPDGFATSIASLLSNAESRQQMGEAARNKAARFDWELAIQQHVQLYEQAIAQQCGRDPEPVHASQCAK